MVNDLQPGPRDESTDRMGFVDLALFLDERRKLLLVAPLLCGALAVGLTFMTAPIFTARAVIMPPQQQQSVAASALASLGALSGLVGGSSGIKNPQDEYVSLLQSVTVSDRIIDRFDLMKVYDQKLRVNARLRLGDNVHIVAGKKDGLISIEVDDVDPKRAADIANRYTEELRWITGRLALTETQQRRVFFEAQVKETREHLAAAQAALQSSGFDVGSLKAEPNAAATNFARLQAQKTAAEVRLQTLHQTLAATSPEVQQQETLLAALSAQLAKVEAATPPSTGADYVSKFREFKYEEALFELFSKQYELARVDESRDSALIQVVDPATPPERKSRPHRAYIGIGTTLAVFLFLSVGLVARRSWRLATAGSPFRSKAGRSVAADNQT